ncbi:TIGR04104 family putative zinc finger protein [Ornithinibacillus salinisoli]|uniref:TIGR04104 family putative zinc finger protein n=1 Tax=Ornithinibacillus salinisoli TaxID=1848459 RepID=A0ABW4W0E4_9BACI
MPTCQHCKKDITYKQTLKMIFRSKCPSCGVKQYASAASRKKSAIYAFLYPVIFFANVFFNFSWWITSLFILIVALIIFSTYPFIMEFSNEEEPFW